MLYEVITRFRFVFLQHNVEVRAAEAEGADRRPARLAVDDPGPFVSGQVERCPSLHDLAQWLLNLDCRWDNLVVQGQRGLDQPGRAGGRLGVADLRLD